MSNQQQDEKLAVIITQTADNVRGSISVDVDRTLPTVCISDEEGVQEDIFLSEDSACQFLDEAESYYGSGTVSMEDALLCAAAPYAETLWN